MDQKNAECDNLIPILWEFIRLEQYDDALTEIKKSCHKKNIFSNSLDIIPAIAAISNESFFNENAEICLEALLIEIAEKSNPKESIIAFLEQMEKLSSISLLNILLKPLSHILKTDAISPQATVSWIFEIIHDKIKEFCLPTDDILDIEEETMLGGDSDSFKHASMLEKIITFYNDILPKTKTNAELQESIVMNIDISEYILLLFENPLLYLHLENDNQFHGMSIDLICIVKQVTGNLLFCLKYIKPYTTVSLNKITKENICIKNLSQLGISSFLYCIMCLNVESNWLPQIYDPFYLFFTCLPSCIYLLKELKLIPQYKGIQFTKHFLELLPNNSLTLDAYEVPNLLNLSRSLIDITLYCGNEQLRKLGLTAFKIYCRKFQKSARVYLIQHILQFQRHSGLHSIVIYEFKEILVDEYKNGCCSFTDNNLCKTLGDCCSLPAGATTDLLEYSDRIISALNLLIFLSIRDKNNLSGWKRCLDDINEQFIQPLNTSLVISTGHYKLQLRNLKENSLVNEQITPETIEESELLPNPVNWEVGNIESSLNCFDLITSLVARLESLLV